MPAFAALLVLWGFTVLAFGAVMPWSRGLAALGLLGIAVVQLRGWPRLPAWGLLILAAAAIQLLPVPAANLSPLRAESALLHGIEWTRISASPFLTMMEAATVAGYLLAGLAAFTAARRGLDLDLAYRILSIAGVVLSLFALLALMQHHAEFPFGGKRSDLDSATGTFVNRNHFAGCLELILPLAIVSTVARFQKGGRTPGSAASASSTWQALTMAAGVVVMVAALILSRSRFGLVSFAASMALMAALWKAAAARRAILALLPLAVGLCLYVGMGPVLARYDRDTVGSELQEGRLKIWRNTLDLVADHPLAGAGFGAFGAAFPPYKPGTIDKRVSHPHNEYLAIAAEFGLPLALLLLYLGFRAARRTWVVLAIGRDRLGIGAVCGLFAILVHSAGDFNLRIPSNGILFAILAGFAASRIAPEAPARAERGPGPALSAILLAAACIAAATLLLPDHPLDGAALVARAEKTAPAGDALTLYRRAAALEPLRATTHYREGELLRKLRRDEEADREMTLADRCDPHYAELQYLVGADRWSRYRKTGRADFRASALSSLARAPDTRALDLLAAEEGTEDDVQALAPSGPNAERALAVSRIRRASRDFAIEEFMRNVPPSRATASAYREVASAAREAGWQAGAVRVLEGLLKAGPDAPALVMLASCWEEMDAIDAARQAADDARKAAPAVADYHALFARYCLGSGDSAAAVEAFTEAARLAPGVASHVVGLARALRQGRRTPEAERRLAEFLQRSPEGRDAVIELARLYSETNRRVEAVATLTPFALKHPDDAEIRSLLERLGSR